MRRCTYGPRTRALTILALVLAIAAPAAWGQDLRAMFEKEMILFAEAEIFFEENATDGDLGIQLFADGEPWRRLILFDADWKQLLDIKVRGNARLVGLTEIFSESAEPSFDELPRADFLALFPPGEYRYFGLTIDGNWLGGTANLTHHLPDQPVVTSPTEDEEVDPAEPFTVEWETVADPDPPDSVIVAYQVIVEKDEDEERLRVFTVDALATDTTMEVPPGFLEPGKDYKVEVLAVETSGNKVITEVPFATEGGEDDGEGDDDEDDGEDG